MAVEAAEIALVAAFDQHRRQAIGEGPARQTAIAHARDQPVGGNGEAMLDHRLAQQGMKQIPGAGAKAVAPEQLGVDELAQLSGLGRRQILDVFQPRMPPPGRGPGSGGAQSQGATEHRPGRMTGPAPHGGEEGRREAGRPFAPEAVGRHRGIGRLEEDSVPALPGQQGRGPAPAHARGDLAVIGDIDALERRTHALAQGAQLTQGDGLDRLADRGEVELQPVGDGLGPGPLVAFAPVAMEVEEPGLPGPAGRGQTAGDDGRIQSAGEFGDDPAVRIDQVGDRFIHHPGQAGEAFVPPGARPAEGRGPPHRYGRLVPGDQGERPGIDRGQPRQRQAVAEQLGGLGDLAQHGPFDGQVRGQERIELARRLRDRQHGPAVAPPDAVDSAGGIAQQSETALVVAPGEDVAPPAGADDRPGKVRRSTVDGHKGRQRPGPTPVADQDMTAADLADPETRARTEQDLQVLDRVRGAPPLAHQVRDRGLDRRAGRLAEIPLVKDQIAMVCGSRARHRRYSGV
jgi:hypothetical protein